MNNADQINEAHEGHLRNTALMLAAQDLESATYAARKAREDLRRATRNRLQAKERHGDAHLRWLEEEPGTAGSESAWVRVDLARWALDNAERDEKHALEDYRAALKRVEVLGAVAGEADSHAVPAYVRHRARKAIALADAFGNKVAMDATLHDGLERPVLPELSPEVEVQEFRVIDPLEPVEAWTPPEPRAVLVPVDDYTSAKIQEGRIHAISFSDPREERAAQLRQSREEEVAYAERLAYIEAERREEGTFVPVENDEDPSAGGWKPEHMSPEWWKQVTFSAPLNVKDPLPEDYSRPEDWEDAIPEDLRPTEEEKSAVDRMDEEAALRLYRILTGELPAPDEGSDDDGSTVPEEDRMHEGERAAFWREVNHAGEEDAAKSLEAAREDAPRLCPECRDGKHGNCDGDAWDDANDWSASCECTSSYHENER